MLTLYVRTAAWLASSARFHRLVHKRLKFEETRRKVEDRRRAKAERLAAIAAARAQSGPFLSFRVRSPRPAKGVFHLCALVVTRR
jgi:hypothetical protein